MTTICTCAAAYLGNSWHVAPCPLADVVAPDAVTQLLDRLVADGLFTSWTEDLGPDEEIEHRRDSARRVQSARVDYDPFDGFPYPRD